MTGNDVGLEVGSEVSRVGGQVGGQVGGRAGGQVGGRVGCWLGILLGLPLGPSLDCLWLCRRAGRFGKIRPVDLTVITRRFRSKTHNIVLPYVELGTTVLASISF